MKINFSKNESAYLGPFIREMGNGLKNANRKDRRSILKLATKFKPDVSNVELLPGETDLLLRLLKPAYVFFTKKISELSRGLISRFKYRKELRGLKEIKALIFNCILKVEDNVH